MLRDDEPLDGRLFGDDQACYGCGPAHPHGMRLAFERDATGLSTRFTPGEDRQGPPGLMHGGQVATLADELAAWTVIARHGRFGFTVSFEGRFHGPVRIGQPIDGRGWVAREDRRVVHVEVELSQGGVLAFSGHFRFVLYDRAQAEKLLGAPLPERWQRFSR